MRAHRKYKYGVTQEMFDAMFVNQEGLCGICKKHKATHIDHVKGTKIVRGLLCLRCNLGIGLLGHNIEFIYNAYVYLRNFFLRQNGIEYRPPNVKVEIYKSGRLV